MLVGLKPHAPLWWLGGCVAWCEGDEEMMVDMEVVTRWWLVWGGSEDDVDGGVIVVAMLWLAVGQNLAGGGQIWGGGKMGARV
ncbi:hypothetical protein Tco_1158749 [Tanacetum coccineum]